jgi:hypothetical protein
MNENLKNLAKSWHQFGINLPPQITPRFHQLRAQGLDLQRLHGPGRLRLSLRRLVFRSELRQKLGEDFPSNQGWPYFEQKSALLSFAERFTHLALDVEVLLQPDCSSNERPRSAFR